MSSLPVRHDPPASLVAWPVAPQVPERTPETALGTTTGSLQVPTDWAPYLALPVSAPVLVRTTSPGAAPPVPRPPQPSSPPITSSPQPPPGLAPRRAPAPALSPAGRAPAEALRSSHHARARPPDAGPGAGHGRLSGRRLAPWPHRDRHARPPRACPRGVLRGPRRPCSALGHHHRRRSRFHGLLLVRPDLRAGPLRRRAWT